MGGFHRPFPYHSMSDQKPLDLDQSVAGEEDPGASIDIAIAAAGPSAKPAGSSPGDEAPAGTPGTCEDLCRACGGSCMQNGSPCPECEGTGKITVGIAGA